MPQKVGLSRSDRLLQADGRAALRLSPPERAIRLAAVSHFGQDASMPDEHAESEQHIVRTLEANQFQVDRAPAGIPDKLDDYQLIVINNWDMESIPAGRKIALEEYVKTGGGLAWIAGERNIYVRPPPVLTY